MLLSSRRHLPEDLVAWERYGDQDAAWMQFATYKRKKARALAAIEEFLARDTAVYAGVSWGKDSVVLAHLIAVHFPQIPLVWVKIEPIFNPDCIAVRDNFLSRHMVSYDEIVVQCRIDESGQVHATGTLEAGFEQMAVKHGPRYISGIRADESAQRKRRFMAHSENSLNTSAPLSTWKAGDVWAYLHEHDLPIHPVYAMSMGGTFERDRLRVASLGGKRGRGFGRFEHEQAYYRDEMIRLGLA